MAATCSLRVRNGALWLSLGEVCCVVRNGSLKAFSNSWRFTEFRLDVCLSAELVPDWYHFRNRCRIIDVGCRYYASLKFRIFFFFSLSFKGTCRALMVPVF